MGRAQGGGPGREGGPGLSRLGGVSSDCCSEGREVLTAQLCLTLCDPVDSSPPGSSVCRILQARILEWVAVPFSRGSSNSGIEPGSPAYRQILYHLSHQGSLAFFVCLFLTYLKPCF